MKEVVLHISDSAFEAFMAMVGLCPDVKALRVGDCIDTKDAVDHCFAAAIREMKERKAFKSPADYAYIMQVTLDDMVTDEILFVKPDEFIAYLNLIGVEDVPGRTTLYDAQKRIMGKYPDWSFADDPKHVEKLRRKNIAVQFLSAFFRHQRMLSDGISDK